MLEKKIGCLPVVQGHTLLGIVTETDFLRYVVDLAE
jgi:CBS domain-containing protein